MNGHCLVLAKEFTSKNSKVDSNGLLPVLLKCVAGTMPNKAILSGSIAKSEGFTSGTAYLVSYTEGAISEDYGRQFNYTNLGEVPVTSMLEQIMALGAPVIVDVLDKDDDNDDSEDFDESEEETEDDTEASEKAPKKTRRKRAAKEAGDLGD